MSFAEPNLRSRIVIVRRGLIMERQVLNHSVAALVCFFTNAAFAQEDAKSFFSEHCTACHNSADQAGKLNVESLRFEPSDPDNFAR